MVKRVVTSIVTLAVLMGSLVACSGSDSELAELRAELEELKEEKNQEATEETEITNDASESVPDDASEPSQASSEEPNSTFDDPCEAATTAKSEEEFRTLAQLCVDQSDYEPTGRLLFEAQCVGIFGDDNTCGGLSQWIIDTGDVLEEGGYTLDKRCFSNAIIEMLQINGSLNNREDEVEQAVRLCVIGDFPATNQQSSPDSETNAILTDNYSWGTGSANKTKQLQELLGLTIDGSYGPATRVSHLRALEEKGLGVSGVPEAPAPTPIDCWLDVVEASYPTVVVRLQFVNGIPENYWMSYTLFSHYPIGDVLTYGPIEGTYNATSSTIDIDLSEQAQFVIPLGFIDIEVSTTGEPQSIDCEPSGPEGFIFEEFHPPGVIYDSGGNPVTQGL